MSHRCQVLTIDISIREKEIGEVTAVNTSGKESGYSNEVKVIVRKGK